MDIRSGQRREQVEEGMWAVLRRHVLVKGAAGGIPAAASPSPGLWKAPHVSQCCNWDCGVACAQMVLRGLGREGERSSLLAALGTRSVWTIDLAMLLHRNGVRFMYCTRTAGVTGAYSTIDFYRANFDCDAPRVQSLFQAAKEAKVGAVQKEFSWQELAVLLSGYDYAAIVLVDSRFLYPAACRSTAPAFPPPSPATTCRMSPTWSTPKRQREDGEGGVSSGGGEGTSGEEEIEAPSRRQRRRPSVQADLDRQGEDAAVRLTPPRSAPSPLFSSGACDQDESGGRDATRNLRVSPAPHAFEGDGVPIPPFATPPAPRSGRKTIACSPLGGGVLADSEDHGHIQDRPWVPVIDSPSTRLRRPLSPSDSSIATKAVGRTFSPPCSPMETPPPSPPPINSPALPPDPAAYCGHYILLVGWSEAEGVFIARDPGLPSSPIPSRGAAGGDPNAHVCVALTPEALDRARRSYGTDEDVLVIDLARSRKGGVAAAPLAAAAAATALAASAATSAAAASAMVGLVAMAAAAAAAGADASTFKEWTWPDPASWFAGGADGVVGRGGGNDVGNCGSGSRGATAGDVQAGQIGGMTQGSAESAARRLAGLLSLGPSGWRFPTVGEAYRGPRMWRSGGATDAEVEAEGEKWAARVASAVEGFLQGGRRAAYTMEGLLQGGATTMEGLMEGGRRAAFTMEGLLEGGRRAAYSLRDSLADVADAPGGAGAEGSATVAWESPGSALSLSSPMSPAPVMSPA